jgi:predicted Zn-dependent protease
MTLRRKVWLCSAVLVLVPAGVAAGWWFYWPHYRLGQAERAAAAGDWARAEELLRPLVRQQPSPGVLLLQVRALRHLGRAEEGETALAKAARAGLAEQEVRRELALLRARRGFTPAVERHLEACRQEKPDDVEVLQALAEGYAAAHRWAEADRRYTSWVELEPDRRDARMCRGRLRLEAASAYMVGRVADAAADFVGVLRLDPSDYHARLYLAHCLVADARMREAKGHLLICRQQHSDRVEPLVGLAACALEEQDWGEADRLLRAAGALEPQSAYVLVMRGDLCLRQDRFAEAVTFFREAVAQEPGNKGAHLKLAQALRQTNRPEEAQAHMGIYQRLSAAKDATLLGK